MTRKQPACERAVRKGRAPLLLVPIAMLAATPLINRMEPRLFGLPLFFWGQFLMIAVSATVVATVMLRARERSPWR